VTKNMKISKLRKNGRSISFRNGFIRISSIYDGYSFKDIIEDVRIKKILYKKVYKDIHIGFYRKRNKEYLHGLLHNLIVDSDDADKKNYRAYREPTKRPKEVEGYAKWV